MCEKCGCEKELTPLDFRKQVKLLFNAMVEGKVSFPVDFVWHSGGVSSGSDSTK